ncbi:hypothetical protein [Phenylobacterium sp.]|uniref:hypothetical protein n=1 Tax=Phenylobacterium sp. TaxID=1871053 RepID=UPI00356B0839
MPIPYPRPLPRPLPRPRHHHRPLSEADAVVFEAEVLEAETIAETDRLAAYIYGAAWREILEAEEEEAEEAEDDGDDRDAQYVVLTETAEALVAVSESMADPAGNDPYAVLGARILKKAGPLLEEIRLFNPLRPLGPVADDPKA